MQGLDVFVTGASRGIGLEFVRQLLARDDVRRVYAAVRSPSVSPALLDLRITRGERLRVLAMNLEREQDIAAGAAILVAEQASLGAVFNIAGLLHRDGGLQPERRLADVRPQDLMQSFAVNALAPLLVAKHLAVLLPRDTRCIYASLSARLGSIGDNRLGGWYAYRGAKAAQNMFTRNLAIELRRRARGVIVVALHPGTVATDLSAPFRGGVAARQLFSVERAAAQLLAVIDALDDGDNGRFVAWDGQPIPW